MTRDKLQKLIEDLSDNSPMNYLGTDKREFMNDNYTKNSFSGLDPKVYEQTEFGENNGMRFFERPIFAVARADDPCFAEIKRPEVVGNHHLTPYDWMPEAKTVISFFIPINHEIVEKNKRHPTEPALEWLYTRVDGQVFILALCTTVLEALIADGHKAVAPFNEAKYIMKTGYDQLTAADIPAYSTNWSERHVAYITGLGTFGLSANFISKLGSSGRLVSVVTDWDIEPDVRDYDDWLGYCLRCGTCKQKCPPHAMYEDRIGKNHEACGGFIRTIRAKNEPRFGCGFCQTGTPCSYRGPAVMNE